jgi:2-C-methyl-D-erythritol 4-phosphate cytidylyltransferase
MTSNRDCHWGAVVVAAGQSARFGEEDKLLAPLAGRPVIAWAVEAAASDSRVREIVVVTGQDNAPAVRNALGTQRERLRLTYCVGGSSRSASVRSGLAALTPSVTHAAVHDGARPLATPELVRAVLDAAELCGAATPAIQPTSSLAVLGAQRDALAGALARERLVEVQTPQAAERGFLNCALAKFPQETDESSALYRAGYRVAVVQGAHTNIKITIPEDLVIARALAQARLASI